MTALTLSLQKPLEMGQATVVQATRVLHLLLFVQPRFPSPEIGVP